MKRTGLLLLALTLTIGALVSSPQEAAARICRKVFCANALYCCSDVECQRVCGPTGACLGVTETNAGCCNCSF